MPKKANLVFVYGSLKEGGYYAMYFDSSRLSVQKAVIKGDLYDGLPFPFVDIEGVGEVHGEVHEYEGFENVLKLIDQIEGFIKEGFVGNLYDRIITKATLEDGKEVDVYVYYISLEKAERYVQSWMKLEKVESGIWEV